MLKKEKGSRCSTDELSSILQQPLLSHFYSVCSLAKVSL